MKPIDSSLINRFNQQLEDHPIYQAVQTQEDLQIFMQHHVYSVWDFMSLIKTLQSVIAPARQPWLPLGDASVRRFINELVLEEESDETHIEGEHSSHFELYLRAMQEVGADTTSAKSFLSNVQRNGIDSVLKQSYIPEPSRQSTQQTFAFINSGKAHEVAGALALGREHIIPSIFRAILKNIGVTEEQAPIFHFYLNRHIHLDEDFHAPLSLQLLNGLVRNETQQQEAIEAAQKAVEARIVFWDGVYENIVNKRWFLRFTSAYEQMT